MSSQSLPDWISPIIKLSDFDGDGQKYIDNLFNVFTNDFIKNTILFRGKKILFDKNDDNGKPSAFVHITTEENKNTKQRELCIRRCERIGWIKPIIEHCNEKEVLVWEAEHFGKRRNSTRIYLFLESDDFLIILEEVKYGYYMLTAIYVDSPHQKRKHLKAHKEFTEKQVK